MKTTYAVIIGLLLFSNTISAQFEAQIEKQTIKRAHSEGYVTTASERDGGDIILTDDFSDFSNWTLSTIGGTSPEWELVTETPSELVLYMGSEMLSPSNANGFAAFNAVTYLIDGFVVPMDALVEYAYPIDCSGIPAVNVEFFMAYRAFNLDEVFVEATNDDWVTFESYELFPSLPSNDPTKQEFVIVDITSVASEEANVKIRFRFKELSGDDFAGAGYGAMIDDFQVKEPWDYDQKIRAQYHRSGVGIIDDNGLEYYMIPTNQIDEIMFSGITENFGGLVQTGAKLNVSVTGAGAYSGTSAPVDLPFAEIDSFFCTTPFVPVAVGEYNVTYWMDSDNPEEFTSNDTLTTEPIYITGEDDQFTYARDNGVPSGSIGNIASNAGSPFLIGNIMEIIANDTISSVDILITADPFNEGQLMYAQIGIFNEDGGAFDYLDQTVDHEIIESDLGTAVRINFEENVILEAGDVILLLAGHYGGDDEVRFQTAQIVQDQSVLGYDVSGSLFFLTGAKAIMIRAQMMALDILDTDEDGILDSDELDADTDEDGIPDFEDPDDDGDGILTIDEGIEDTDEDGIPDYLDDDDDGDGILTADELDTDEDGVIDDTDEDGIPDYLDDDDDGDGILTEIEGTDDTDEDGILDYLDTDDDGDGVDTEEEGTEDTDDDGIPDYLDTDDDGDGVLTEDELDEDEDGVYDDIDDDGIPDYLDNLTEVDGIDEELISYFTVDQNFPNPFAESTSIRYVLKNNATVLVEFKDATGRVIYSVNEGEQSAGVYNLAVGSVKFAKGIYFYSFYIDSHVVTKSMVVE